MPPPNVHRPKPIADMTKNELRDALDEHGVRHFRLKRPELVARLEQAESEMGAMSALDRLARTVGVSSEALVAELGTGVLAFVVPAELLPTIASYAA